MLKLEGIHVYYEESRAVSDVSISVKEAWIISEMNTGSLGKIKLSFVTTKMTLF